MRHAALALALIAGLSAPAFAQSSQPIGVPDCDAFLTAFDRCLSSNVPAAERAQVSMAVTQMRDSWRELARDPQMRAMLAPQCTEMRQQMVQSMAAYNCRF